MNASIDASPHGLYLSGMAQDIWIGIEASEGQAQGWHFDGTRVLSTATGPTIESVTAQLGDGPALFVKAGQATQPAPAPVLSDALPLPDLTQDKPRGLLCAVARLRIAGALRERPNWDGVVCLPMADATHWCQISANEIVSFQSALTPRLAQILNAADIADPEALADTMSRPERLALHLRSATLSRSGDTVAGHLLGAELAAMRPYWLGQQVITIARNSLYSGALGVQGVPVETLDPQDASRLGLISLHEMRR